MTAEQQKTAEPCGDWIESFGGSSSLTADCPVRCEFTDGEIIEGVAGKMRWSSPYPGFPVVKRYQVMGITQKAQPPLPAAPTQIDAGELRRALEVIDRSSVVAGPEGYKSQFDLAIEALTKLARAHLSKLSGGE